MDEMRNVVTPDDIDGVVSAIKHDDSTFVWHGLEVACKYRLTFFEMLDFVDSVVSACFSDGDGGFYPEVKEHAIRVGIVTSYTNIELYDDIEKQYDAIMGSDLVDCIVQNIDKNQFQNILDAIDDKISYEAESRVEALRRRIEDAYNAVEAFIEQANQAFGGLTPDDVSGIVGALSGGKLDEGKLMDAYLKQNSV